MSKPIIIGLLLLVLLGLGLIIFRYGDVNGKRSLELGQVAIGSTIISVELADTPEKQSQGLSGRKTLADGVGLLFVFEKAGKYGFWMKDMNFAIDIIWISAEMEVIGIERSLSPQTYPEVYYPPKEVKYVLEVPAGYAERQDIKVGEILSIGQKKE